MMKKMMMGQMTVDDDDHHQERDNYLSITKRKAKEKKTMIRYNSIEKERMKWEDDRK